MLKLNIDLTAIVTRGLDGTISVPASIINALGTGHCHMIIHNSISRWRWGGGSGSKSGRLAKRNYYSTIKGLEKIYTPVQLS